MKQTIQFFAISTLLVIASFPYTQSLSLRNLESDPIALRNLLSISNIIPKLAVNAPSTSNIKPKLAVNAPVQNYFTHVQDRGVANVIVAGIIVTSENATVVIRVTGSYNEISGVTIIASENCSVTIQVVGNHNIISGLTITCSGNAVLNLYLYGSYNTVQSLILSITDDAQVFAGITGQSNIIYDVTITACDNSYQVVDLNSLNQLNQVNFATNRFSRSQVLLTGFINQVDRLKISGSGLSYSGFNMPDNGFLDDDRNMNNGGNQTQIVFVPQH